ncbi:MAG: phosphatase PAP2 family protein [Chitinophagaceae bacterium]
MMKYICTFLVLSVLFINSYGQTDTFPPKKDTIPTQAQDTVVTEITPETIQPVEPVRVRLDGEEVYRLKPAIDIPLTAVTASWSLYAFTKIYNKDPSTQQEIDALRVSDINGFDRWAADVYSDKAANTSDIFFYGAMPLPVILLFDKHIRRDAGKYAFLYLEAMSITGLFYTGSVYLVDRYRPLAYNPEVPMDERKRGGSKNSFIAGHPALVATSSFFTAKVFADYHPESPLRWLFYSAAVVSTGGTAYLRHRGGKHFPSDLLIGTTIGTLSGLLVPHFHKNPVLKNSDVTIFPFIGNGHGVAVVYRF